MNPKLVDEYNILASEYLLNPQPIFPAESSAPIPPLSDLYRGPKTRGFHKPTITWPDFSLAKKRRRKNRPRIAR